MDAGCHLFIEKPLSVSDDNLETLEATVSSRRKIGIVGYNFRFYRPLSILRTALQAGRIGTPQIAEFRVGQFLPDWRKGRSSHDTVSAQRALGGGALLELSHELDILRWTLGEAEYLVAIAGRVSDVTLDTEDVADLILTMRTGVRATIHLDFLQRKKERRWRVAGTKGAVEWCWDDHVLRISDENGGVETRALFDYGEGFSADEMYREEIAHFIDLIEGRCPDNRSPISEARRTLQLVSAARRSALTGQVVFL